MGRCLRRPKAASAGSRVASAGSRGVSERSEEHTSELQSHSDLVCRLLLEKKKKNRKTCKAYSTNRASLPAMSNELQRQQEQSTHLDTVLCRHTATYYEQITHFRVKLLYH